MTTMNIHEADLAVGKKKNYLNQTNTIWSWLFTLDHKRIGLMYLVAGLTLFFIGGMLAEVVRTQLLVNVHAHFCAFTPML